MNASNAAERPNVVFVFADQWRAQATGYAGNPDVQTPNLDRLTAESVNCTHAVSGTPVCSPYRASFMTGQFPLTHGVFVNDVCLQHRSPSIADAFRAGGYDTAYIGKWHLDGHGRSAYIPPERRQGFQYWKVLECTHNYNKSAYYEDNDPTQRVWDGYDAFAQTRDAQRCIRNRNGERPFFLVLSWGPPHAPYKTAPEAFRALYDPLAVTLRPNVPESSDQEARDCLAGYYAHCSALDQCVGDLLRTLDDEKLTDNTIFVFTSDHGDMLGSHGLTKKQKPWDESIRVPFLIRWPLGLGRKGRENPAFIDAPDLMPTLLGLCGLPIPDSVQGVDLSDCLAGGEDPGDGAVLLACHQPFGQWRRGGDGPPEMTGREYRGLRTRRYTYARDLQGPWLLYDNREDPCQLNNRIHDPDMAEIRRQLDNWLQKKLNASGDDFRPGLDYIREWDYPVDETGTVPYQN